MVNLFIRFTARNIDLPRKIRYRPRRKKKEFKVDRGCYIGRSYEEYQKLLNKNTDIHPAQIDSVIGTVGGKVLLTIHLSYHFFTFVGTQKLVFKQNLNKKIIPQKINL